jgi:hypothetical protein
MTDPVNVEEIKMRLRLLIFLFLATVGTAYAAKKMDISENQQQLDTPPDQSQIIFVRPVGGLANTSIYDVTNGEPQFIGIIHRWHKLAHIVEPGNYTFMVSTDVPEFIVVNMAAGKTYYAMVFLKFGPWYGKDYIGVIPIRKSADKGYQIDSKKFQKWLAKAKFVENNEAAIEWATANHAQIVETQTKNWEKWEAKSDEEIAEQTLEESDGI